jgi:hypothetical protein
MDTVMTVGLYKWRGISWESDQPSVSGKYSYLFFVIAHNYVHQTNQSGVLKRTRMLLGTSDEHNLIWTLHRVYWLFAEACAEKPLWKFILWAEGVTRVAVVYGRVCPTLFPTLPTVSDRSRATAAMVIVLLRAPFSNIHPDHIDNHSIESHVPKGLSQLKEIWKWSPMLL